jgi:hypothetical protein
MKRGLDSSFLKFSPLYRRDVFPWFLGFWQSSPPQQNRTMRQTQKKSSPNDSSMTAMSAPGIPYRSTLPNDERLLGAKIVWLRLLPLNSA